MKGFVTAVILVSVIGCNQRHPLSGKDSKHHNVFSINTAENGEFEDFSSRNVITIIDEKGSSIAGARVLIGNKLNEPFSGNLLTSDNQGKIVVPSGWIDKQPVTIDAKGYIRATYMQQDAISQTFSLRLKPTGNEVVAAGTTTNFGPLSKDGIVDFGLVIPALNRTQIFNFRPEMIVSPHRDKITVLGKTVDVPSNMTLPEQKESYMYVPVTFNKPTFSLYEDRPLTKPFFALHGQVPISKLIDGITQDTPFMELVNLFTFISAGYKEFQFPGVNYTLPVNEISFTQLRTIRAPSYDPSLGMVSIAMFERDGLLLPSDIKFVDSQSSKALHLPLQFPNYFALSAIQKRNALNDRTPDRQQMTIALMNFFENALPNFLPLIQLPVVKDGNLYAQPPGFRRNVMAAGVYSLLSIMVENPSAKAIAAPMWEFYSDNWVDTIVRPQFPDDQLPTAKFRWEISFLGIDKDAMFPDEKVCPNNIKKTITHVSHHGTDF